jgi:hypothetical protein
MIDKIFGEVTFNSGWCKNDTILLWGKEFALLVRAKSYYESDEITDIQREEYNDFTKNKANIALEIEKLIVSYKGRKFIKELTPRFLIFQRQGGYALLADDKTDPDNGIAIVLSPHKEVMTQDDYL